MRYSTIHIRTDMPDYSDIPDKYYERKYTVYGNVEERKHNDLPTILGKTVTFTTYIDANLLHDMTNGISVTGFPHLMKKTPYDLYSKMQGSVETATYGSVLVVALITVEQIISNFLSL